MNEVMKIYHCFRNVKTVLKSSKAQRFKGSRASFSGAGLLGVYKFLLSCLMKIWCLNSLILNIRDISLNDVIKGISCKETRVTTISSRISFGVDIGLHAVEENPRVN